MKTFWTRRALAALTSVHEFISSDNPKAANALRDKAVKFVELTLVAQPLIGRPGRVKGARESVIHPSYIIVYRVKGKTIEIITVRHTSQHWPKSF